MPRSSTLGLNSSPSTSTSATLQGSWSSAAASIERQGVMRVQDRSVSPGEYASARSASSRIGFSAVYMSVTRRWASAPSGSRAASTGALTGHHTTTGASGRSSGRTTDWAWLMASP